MKKKIMALLLAALLVVGILPITAMATTSYDYYEWNESQKKLVAANTGDKEVTVIVINASNKPTELNGWYYVDSELTVSDAVELTGETNIILGTGAEITFDKGIIQDGVITLNIYGVNANGTGGTLIANGSDGNSSGGLEEKNGQPGIEVSYFNMHGGTVTVTGGKGLDESATNGDTGGNGIKISEKFNMYGGAVTATGGSGGNGTNNNGGGDGETGISMSEFAPFNMYGGTVTATGGSGGSGCNYESNKGGNGGVGISNIKMYGGTVNTKGGNGGSGDHGGDGGFGLYMLSMTGGEIVVKGGQGGTGEQIPGNGSAAIAKDDSGYYTPKLGDFAVAMNGTNPIPKGFVITTDTNVDGSTKAKWAPNGTALNDASYKYVEILFGEDEEDDTPDEVRHSYTTITIGGNKDKAETKAEEVKEEENPDTGAPVMNLGAVAVVLGAAYVLSKKH